MTNITEAGNTFYPALAALKLKGYKTRSSFCEQTGQWRYYAYREENRFSAFSTEALLGIVCVGETYGDNWQSAIRKIDFDEQEEYREDSEGTITATITDQNGTRTITY